VPELALDDVERDALAGQRVPVAQLVRREATPDPRLSGESAELAADRGAGPRSPAGRSVDDAEQRIRLEGEGGGTLRSALDAVVHVGDTGLPLEDPGAL
jgi:hypothetical protein